MEEIRNASTRYRNPLSVHTNPLSISLLDTRLSHLEGSICVLCEISPVAIFHSTVLRNIARYNGFLNRPRILTFPIIRNSQFVSTYIGGLELCSF